ncbi:ATP-dependent DNA helicase 2 subunit KU80 [Humulus lupulus]|uniref:ATP-dependent DNA helicase 2 subunit KU80 n=1 Tax=Humulus lupulus TaxID=3486 RepID=UPI002B405DE2|nr:ATP-dependent DNA helicase 2 subunit KU80 [Humulus lupulus]
MARNKETLLLLIDVGPSMHNAVPEIEKVCFSLIQKKLIHSKYDEVGVILFGTQDTDNELTNEVGGYEHVVVLRKIGVVDLDLLETLQPLSRGTHSGDFLDAIIVGMDMLIKKYGVTNKGKKRLCLITNAICPIKPPNEGTKDDQVTIIADQMNAQGMKMESIVVRGKLIAEADKRIMEENDRLLNIFSNRTRAKLVHVESPISLLGALRTRNVSPVTTFRGDLEISPKLKIKIWVYKKTSEEKFPTLKRYSDKAPSTDKFATHEVKVDFEYKRVEDPSKVVPPEQRIKGYRYGPQVVPISSAEWDAVKFKPEKSVKVLGFTDAGNIMRHYYMKDANVFIPEPGNTKAILAASALARAMKEANKVAILRCVWRQGQGNVVVGVLTPNISNRDNIPDSFYFNVLPFAEDVREFQFPSFSNLPTSMQPTEQQQEAADRFVQMFDLAPSDKEEALLPEFTPNPVLERFHHYLELKSKHPDAAVPPLDETLAKITEPDPELISQNNSVLDEFRMLFNLKENPKLKKSARRSLQEKPSGSNDGKNYALLPAPSANPDTNEHKSSIKVEEIRNATPIQDFEAMISRRDSPKWVDKAITDMKNKIFNLIEDSHNGDNYPKTVECLAALRKGCVLEQEPKQFNDFLHHLFKYCQEKRLTSFCEFLASKQITLISKTEAVDSEVTDEEARSFVAKAEPMLE